MAPDARARRRRALEEAVRHHLRLLRDAQACGLVALAKRRRRRLRHLRTELASLARGELSGVGTPLPLDATPGATRRQPSSRIKRHG
jgi:hypothetical protein